MTVTRIEADADQAARHRNGRRSRSRLEAAQDAAAAAARAAEAAAVAAETAAAEMREARANPLVAALDAESLGAQLTDGDRDAVLTLVRSLEGRAVPPLPQRQPNGTGAQDGQRT
jgi:hypothetical protein